MILDNPVFELRVTAEDALGILKRLLKQRHWKKFDVANLGLNYVPYWFFNFDVYEEVEGQSQTYSSQMCMNAITGKLEPMLIEIMKTIPVRQEKEIREQKYDIKNPAVKEDEARSTAPIKIAGMMHRPKDTITVSGLRLVYVPTWVIWVDLASGTKRIDLDAISGSPLNIQNVPTKERGFLEVTADTLEELKTPAGWVDYSKKMFDWSLGALAGAGQQASAGAGLLTWVTNTTAGRYSALILIAAALIIYIFYFK